MRANIRFINPNDNQFDVMVTSTISRGREDLLCYDLASVLFPIDGQTKRILVGCDMRKPKIFPGFGIQNDTGLSTVFWEWSNRYWRAAVSRHPMIT